MLDRRWTPLPLIAALALFGCSDEAPPEEDEDAVLMEALLQMSDEDRQDALRTYAIRLADKFADV